MVLRSSNIDSAPPIEKILVVEGDIGVQALVGKILRRIGYEVEIVPTVEQALSILRGMRFDIILLDVKHPGISAMDAIPQIKEIDSDVVIMLMTPGEVQKDNLCAGLTEIDVSSRHLRELETTIREALKRHQSLGSVMSRTIIGESEPIRGLRNLIRKVAPLDSTVLITGESGTGKELVADMIHYHSGRTSHPFIKMNCAAIPESLLEGEVFGHEKGAFTGASGPRPGKFELADKGTILLDEIGDMPLGIQAKLLRIIEQKQVERLGGRKSLSVDTRVVAATNQDLAVLTTQKRFRADLYYRLNVIRMHVPSLRERLDDLPLLVEHFLRKLNLKLGTSISGIAKEAIERLFSYHWPGNVRELANVLERAVIMDEGTVLSAEAVSCSMQYMPSGGRTAGPLPTNEARPEHSGSLSATLEEIEKKLIMAALLQTAGIQTEAAKILGLNPKNLWKKINKHGIDPRRLVTSPSTAREERSPAVERESEEPEFDNVIIFPGLA